MTSAVRYFLRFAGSSAVVEARGPAAEQIAGIVCARRPGSGGDNREAPPEFRLEDEPETGRVALFQGERLLTRNSDRGWLADRLVRAAGARLADGASGALVFHAGAMARAGRGVLLPGGTGGGKSTLTGWLALQGWGYLSDELAAIPFGGTDLDGFSRPLGLKKSSLPLFAAAFDFDRLGEGVLPTPHGALIAPDRLGDAPPRPVPLKRIVFPDYRAGRDFELALLSPARAAARLMGCLLNARNLPEDGLAIVVRLAGQVPAFSLRYGGFGQLGERGERLWGNPA